jgi:hypothetical protein
VNLDSSENQLNCCEVGNVDDDDNNNNNNNNNILIPAEKDNFHKRFYKCCKRNFKEFSAPCIFSTKNISELRIADCTADYNYTLLNT